MLGEIVARLDGRSWYDAIKNRILDPLEMRRRLTAWTADRPPPGSTCCRSPTYPCGSSCSTSADGRLRRPGEYGGGPGEGAMFVADPVDEGVEGHPGRDVPGADHGRHGPLAACLRPRLYAEAARRPRLRRPRRRYARPHHVDLRPPALGHWRASRCRTPPAGAWAWRPTTTKVLEDDLPRPAFWVPGTPVPAGSKPSSAPGSLEALVRLRQERLLEAGVPHAAEYLAPAVFERVSDDLYRTVS